MTTLIPLDELTLVRRENVADQTAIAVGGGVSIGIGRAGSEDYWSYRVQLTDAQAIIGFPKFGTIGIGFLVEDDWNSNLPYGTAPANIADHIGHNRLAGGDEAIPRDHAVAAITLIREAAGEDRGKPACRRCEVPGHWSEDCPDVHEPRDMEAYWIKDAAGRVRDADGWPLRDDDE